MDPRTLTESQWQEQESALVAARQCVPRGVWGRAVDALAVFRKAGNAWVEAGKPRNCPLYADFCEAEREYNAACDAADGYPWSKEQRDEWTRVFKATESGTP